MAKETAKSTLRKKHTGKRAPYSYGSKCMDIAMANWKTTYIDPNTKKPKTQVVSAMGYPNTIESVRRHNASLKIPRDPKKTEYQEFLEAFNSVHRKNA